MPATFADGIDTILLCVHLGLILIITLRILARYDLTSSARLAWFVVILSLPYLGIVIYWMFGEIHVGSKIKRGKKDIIAYLHQAHPKVLGSQEVLKQEVTKEYQTAFSYAGVITGFFTTRGNKAKLMQDADDTVAHMIADFDKATDHIHVLYYIWLTDKTGMDTAQALCRAAKRGVTCRAMVDALGSRKMVGSPVWQEMKAAGVQLSTALPYHPLIKVLLTSRIDLRNHRKITIIDGMITYCGSRNCADPEFRVKPKYAPWVDIMMRFTGPVVAQNQMLFASDWITANPETPLDAFSYPLHPQPDGFAAQVFAAGPTMRRGATPQFLLALIVQARHTLIISTPYFVPDYSLVNTLCATALRGVEVKLIVPKNNDSVVVAATSRSYYWQLLEAGVQIYEFRDGLLHAKTLTIDHTISLIGSTNLDLRSFDLNFENNIVFNDKTLTEQIMQRQYQYIDNADIVIKDAVGNWSLPYRIWNNVVATMGPIL